MPGIRVRAPLALIVAALAIGGCSPVYWFQTSPESLPQGDQAAMRSRLDAYLQSQGFRSVGNSDRAIGDIGCGRTAPDRVTYEKEWRDAGYQWVWVHEFSCDGKWQFVIVSSPNAEDRAAQLREALLAEFSRETALGAMTVKTRHRIPLE